MFLGDTVSSTATVYSYVLYYIKKKLIQFKRIIHENISNEPHTRTLIETPLRFIHKFPLNSFAIVSTSTCEFSMRENTRANLAKYPAVFPPPGTVTFGALREFSEQKWRVFPAKCVGRETLLFIAGRYG